METTVKKLRGFALLSAEKRQEISMKGGKAAHALGVAHKFMTGSEEAREAGRKGGKAVHERRAQERLNKAYQGF